ncbi:MAG TPA: magnesium-translocating P-type ATPase [Usitatibacteraceae bacterium]|nr:magnesium-translocating P-type ATPase [Usitatibacteraceae bacterium]
MGDLHNEGGTAWWSVAVADLLASLAAGAQGLSPAEARTRLRTAGPNLVTEERRFGWARLLLSQFTSPLVLILVFAGLVSLVLRDWVEAAIILAIVAGSALLGFVQEFRASKAVAELQGRIALGVRVRRGGEILAVPARDLVPGDMVLLAAGNLVPADGRVLEARDFLVSEAALTGESFPVEKRPADLPPGTPLAARTNSAFLGTSVRSGTATMLVVRTGRFTALGEIAARLGSRVPETEFARGIRQFGYLLVRVMVVMVVFVMAVNQWLGRPVLESLLFAVALAVGISPELLPAIMSVTLSRGARHMARSGVIVRRLEAIENLGSMDILCTDKTGTLTEGLVTLDAALDAQGQDSPEVRRLAHLNAAFETGIENPLDTAIVEAGKRDGLTTAGWRKVDEIPYDFIRKRLTIVAEPEGNASAHLMITKGAFDTVLAASSAVDDAGTVRPLDATLRSTLTALHRDMGEAGFRALALARREVDARDRYEREDERDLVFMGFLRFADPPKPDAQDTIRDLAAMGVSVKIITGDNRWVAGHIASVIGLDHATMLTGEQVAAMPDESLWHLAGNTALFVEVDPQQKERIVRALQHGGHAVGYLGDGINDAPALHAADVGISVDGAVDVARESADVILLRRDLNVLRRGIEDGRHTFANTLKYIKITTSANFGNMVSMALATPLLPFLPLAAKQILLNNFLSDLPSVAISTDHVDRQELAGSQRWDVTEVRRFMVVFGLLSTAFDLLTFYLLLRVFDTGEAEFQTVWFIVSLLTELAVVFVLRTRGPAFASRPSALLAGSSLLVAAAALAVPWLGPVSTAFGFVPVSAGLFGASILVVVAYIVATEAAKRHFYRH